MIEDLPLVLMLMKQVMKEISEEQILLFFYGKKIKIY
jgi:hypothetical protein